MWGTSKKRDKGENYYLSRSSLVVIIFDTYERFMGLSVPLRTYYSLKIYLLHKNKTDGAAGATWL